MAISSELDKYLKELANDMPVVVQGAFELAAEGLVKELQTSLAKKQSQIATGALLPTIGVLPLKNENGTQVISIEWEQYGNYADQGVRGSDSSMNINNTSPFSYKTKRPPASAFTVFANSVNISPFAVANSIFKKGTKGNLWATSVLDNNALIDRLFETVGEKFVNEMNT